MRAIGRHATMRLALVLPLLGASLACSSNPGPMEPVVRTIEVAENRVPCVAVGPRECLRTRAAPDEPWQLFYSEIVGFTHEPGFRYVLRVVERPVPNPPADGSSISYTLASVVSKTAVP